MPYSKDELKNPQSNIYTFYNALITEDEDKYLKLIEKKTVAGDLSDGILREKKTGKDGIAWLSWLQKVQTWLQNHILFLQ